MARIASLVVLLVVLLVPAANAAGPAATVRALDRQMNQAGTGSSALVIDLDSGATLYARRPDVPRIPASVNKLYTTSAAMTLYGDEGTLTTEVLGDSQPDDDGVVTGNLYLRGDGDPSLSKRWVPGPGLDSPMQELAEKVVRGRLSVRAAEALVRTAKSKTKKPGKPGEKSASVRDLEARLTRAAQTKVVVRDHGNKGEVAIPYEDLDHLDRILARVFKVT